MWFSIWLCLGLLLAATPAHGQVKFGQLTLGMTGTLGVGYDASLDSGSSSHDLGLNGTGTINGSYYDPRLLSFTVNPTYDRSQSNSSSASLTESSGVAGAASIFSGSHFPGSISFSKFYNTTGTYGVPAGQGLTTEGNSSQLSAQWTLRFLRLPPLQLGYGQTSTSGSIFGTDQDNKSSSRSFTASSSYKYHGWPINAHFSIVGSSTETPALITGTEAIDGKSRSIAFSAQTSHKLPLNGSLAMSYSFDDYDSSSVQGGVTTNSSGSGSDIAVTANVMPRRWVMNSVQVNYVSSLTALAASQLASAGGTTSGVPNSAGSNYSISVGDSSSVYLPFHLSLGFNVGHITQQVNGVTASSDHYNAIANYNFRRPLWGSVLIYAGVNDSASDGVNNGAGLVSGINFSRVFKGVWSVGAGIAYSQDVQTVVAAVTTSNFSYQATVSRPLARRVRWFGSFNGFHSGFSQVAGNSSHSEGLSSNIVYHNLGVAANYNQSNGATVIGQNGVVSVPVGLPTSALGITGVQLSSSKTYGISCSGSFRQKLAFTGNYSHSVYGTDSAGVQSSNPSSILAGNATYTWRRMGFTAGYSRLSQGGGSTGTPASTLSSYYVGISRWFRAF